MQAPIRTTESESILRQLWIIDSDPSLIQRLLCYLLFCLVTYLAGLQDILNNVSFQQEKPPPLQNENVQKEIQKSESEFQQGIQVICVHTAWETLV